MRTFVFLILATLVGACAVELQKHKPVIKVDKKFLRPPAAIKYFTFGYNDFLASVLWIRLVQNLEYCEEGQYTGDLYVEPTKNKDRIDGILERTIKPSKCNLGWVYSMTDVISDIQPHFKIAYDVGGLFLSVAVDDREGARRIFEKGLTQYPKDWQLNYMAGYHYLWEIQNPSRAAELFDKAAENGAPKWVTALSAALYSKTGRVQIAKTILQNALNYPMSEKEKERIKLRLEQAEKILKENH
ncbi:MAG: hypothetical protein H6623_03775 [Bdellovibrionaceae bacterium]|nr:hypothetical protein [Pseudobdellovibrionaceae bacterium]